MTRNLHVSADRLKNDLEAMARITDPDRPWTRRAFSPLFDEGRRWLRNRFEEAGLACSIDAGGNLVGLVAGSDPDAGTIMIGSHSDTVPNGGRFDGIAGVLVALEVARCLKERGIRLKHSLAVADFLAEEVSIFGLSCIGSRAMAGVLPADWLGRQSDGRELRQALGDVGGDAARLDGPLRQDLKAFLELHIEQGPVLEQEGIDVGVVTAIVGITRIEVIVTGRADHAGTTPMDRRADALTAAAVLVNDINRTARKMARTTGRHFTATVGEFDIEPNAANVVPGRVRMLIDARAEVKTDMEAFIAFIAGRSTAAIGPVTVEHRVLSDNPRCCHERGGCRHTLEGC